MENIAGSHKALKDGNMGAFVKNKSHSQAD